MNSFENDNSTGRSAAVQTRSARRIALYACAVAALTVVAAFFSSNAGLCVPERKFLSDEELFKGAVNVVIHDPIDGVTELVPGATIAKLVQSQRYSNADDFLRENPDCCRFVPANSGDGGPQVGIVDRLSGVRVVEVSYVKKYLGEAGEQKASKVSGRVAVTSCGNGRPFR